MTSDDDFYGPVNLGNPSEFTILELAQIITKLTKSNSRIIYRPLPADDPAQRKPDITLAETMLHWRPKIELAQGLASTIKYFREVL